MSKDDGARRRIASHVRAAAVELAWEADQGRFDGPILRDAAAAATFLEVRDAASKLLAVLSRAPDAAFHCMFDCPKSEWRTVPRRETLELWFPLHEERKVLERVRASADWAPSVALCLKGRFQEAQRLAESEGGYGLERLGRALAVLGEIDASLAVACHSALDLGGQIGVLQALTIELFRRGRIDEYEVVEAEFDALSPDYKERLELALGLAGREVAYNYPFSRSSPRKPPYSDGQAVAGSEAES